MKCSPIKPEHTSEIIELFTVVFAQSEGEAEGRLIGALVSDLIAWTDTEDLHGCVAFDGGRIVGCALFSRFIVPDDHMAFILSPLAVSINHQRNGIGQHLVRNGLDHLKTLQAEFVFVYGDPAYYSKSGFERVDAEVLQAPFPLSYPSGWQALSLDGKSVHALHGKTKCDNALRDPKYW